ncbi:MAG: cytochrome c-type biogenesis protein CcmH [Chloroflexota bacterium]
MQTKPNFNTFRFSFFVLLFLVLALAPLGKALAQEPTPSDDQVNAIAKQLYCPVCENTPLDVCPTEACRQWRELIRSQLANGWTEDQIKQYFVDNYGDRVLAAPPPTGLNWMVYVVPPIIILLGAFILFRALRAWTKPSTASAGLGQTEANKSVPQDDYVARLEEELKKRK